MKTNRIIAFAVLAILVVPALVFAAPQDRGRKIINLKMGVMVLPFNHWKHQKGGKKQCFNCHKTRIGKIDNWNKDTAHQICIPCHDLENKGPVQCHECHKKK